MKDMICLAHRGASGHEVENSLPAMEKAIEMGADWVELDVQTVDDKLIVFHDSSLDRLTSATGLLKEKSFEYLRSLNLDNKKELFIPTLREVFEQVRGRININIELKDRESLASTISLIQEFVREKIFDVEQFLISSFYHCELFKAKRIEPAILIGALMIGLPLDYARFAEDLGAYSVHPNIGCVTREFVDDARSRGLKTFAFTSNDKDSVERMKDLSVDGVFTNFPELLKVQT